MNAQILTPEDDPKTNAPAAETPRPRRWRPRGLGPAFWTLASIF